MKILIGVHSFFPDDCGGTGVLVHELARGLRDLGHQVNILSGKEEGKPERKGSWLTEDVYDGFKVYRIHYYISPGRDPITPQINSPVHVKMTKEIVQKIKPDLVHFNHLMGFSAQVIPEIRALNFPVIFTPTDYWTVCPKRTLLKTFQLKNCEGPEDGEPCLRCFINIPEILSKTLMKLGRTSLKEFSNRFYSTYSLGKRLDKVIKSVNQANGIITETQFLANILTKHGVHSRLIKCIPNGVNIGRMPPKIPFPDNFNVENPLRLGFIGSISFIKGPHVIIEALLGIKDRNQDVILDIYGKLDDEDVYSQKLIELSKKSKVKIQFKGTFTHEKIGEILRTFHALVIPSLWYESAPLVLCSALQAGIPVLVSRYGGMTELVEEGIHGFSFVPGDTTILRKIILKFLTRPSVIKRIYEKERSIKRTNKDYVLDVEKFYKEIIQRKDKI